MATAPVPAFRRLHDDSRLYLDIGIIVAAGIHLLGFLVANAYDPAPYTIAESAIEVVPIADPVTVPLPPLTIPKPPIPMMTEFHDILVTDTADPDETIIDTKVNIEKPPPARLAYGIVESGNEEWTSFAQPAEPKKLYRPVYPELARSAGIEGTVTARVYVDDRGRVVRVEILHSPSEIFDRAVIDALMKSEFYPAMQRDIPVKCRVTVPVTFSLVSCEEE